MWRISIHRDFDSFGGPLSPCGSHLLRLEPFTQIRSRTLCTYFKKQYFTVFVIRIIYLYVVLVDKVKKTEVQGKPQK